MEAAKDTKAGSAENTEKRKHIGRKMRNIIIAAVVMLLTAAIILLLVRFSVYQQEAVHRDKTTALMDVTDKTGEVFSVIQTVYEPITEMIESELKTGKHREKQDIIDLLSHISAPVLNDRLYTIIIDRKTDFISSDGHSGHWTDISSILDAVQSNNIYIGTIPSLGSDKQFVFFIRETNFEIPSYPEAIRYVIAAMEVEALSERLVVNSFGRQGCAYIIRNDGRVVFRQKNTLDLFKSYNVLKSMQDLPFKYNTSLQQLKDAIKAGENTACCFDYNGEEYYVANQTLMTKDWSILVFAKSTAVSVGMSQMIDDTMTYVILISAAVLLIILLLAYAFVSTIRERDKREQDKVRELNVQLQEAAEMAEDANQAKTVFLSNMSHDIRTPINGVMGMTAIALKEPNNPPRTEDCLHKIDAASSHLLSLVNDILDLSRIEQHKVTITKAPMDLKTVISDCGTIIRGQMNGRNINYREIWKNDLHSRVLGDELHLRQIIINIIGNSVKFTPDGGTISVTAENISEADGKATFRFIFADTGIGMKPEYIPKIFEAFSQEEGGARSKYKGTGLGMPITKQFIELMGGTVAVESELNKGTTFIVEIPFEIDQSEPIETADVTEAESIEGMRILLVEDNELNMEIATELLEDEGAVVIPAENGQEAVETFRSHEPGTYDVILMDIMMPVMNGYEATKAIRGTADRPDAADIPIIAMSANAFEEDVRKSLSVGMNDHLSKPIEIAKVLQAVSRYSNHKNQENGKDHL